MELIAGADKVLMGYNRLLAKAVFTTAWVFSMHISEISMTKITSLKWADSIRTSDVGLSMIFESDKTSQRMKNRTVRWKKLPNFTHRLEEEYMALCLKGVHNFFCKEDSQPLDRNDVLNLLDVCVLQTGWKKFTLTLHSFRQGRALEECLVGGDFKALQHECHWSHQSRAFNVYAWSDLVTLPMQQVYSQYPKYRSVNNSQAMLLVTGGGRDTRKSGIPSTCQSA